MRSIGSLRLGDGEEFEAEIDGNFYRVTRVTDGSGINPVGGGSVQT